jgi:pimeloyl-ACP methyl ester carboxylesterase
MHIIFKLLVIVLFGWAGTSSANPTKTPAERPMIVLVHGAFADSSSWDAVTNQLLKDGYRVVATANPLRSVQGDASDLSSLLASVDGDVVLVGHSYAGIVMSQAAANAPNVKSLVFVAGYAPDVGESAVSISGKFPEGTLGQALAKPVLQPDGGKDLYIEPAKFWQQFAADVPESDARRMAATQRPVREAALGEPVTAAAWKSKPSWFIYGASDKNIPRSALAFMANRAKAKETVEVAGASHVVMISHPAKVVAMIKRAAGGR